MLCTNPTTYPNSNGPVACGQCLSCRITKRTRWRTRLMLENKFWNGRSLFVTLTYAPEHLPMQQYFKGGELVKKHLQDFVKRVRRNIEYQKGKRKITYYGVGEYGEKSSRAHYHIILYNVDDRDVSVIEQSWKFGHVHFGEANSTTLGYTLGYTLKKLTSEKDFPDGRQPEFALMSKGLGARYLDAIAVRLKKHKLYPARSITQYEEFILGNAGARPFDLGLKEWDGTFFMDGVRCSLDSFCMKKIAKILDPVISDVKHINESAIFDDRETFLESQAKWKARKDRLTNDALNVKIAFEEDGTYEEALKQAKKIHYQSRKRRSKI